jgi:phosphoserine aminotransferase
MKKHNFSSGPSILPQEVFEKAAAAVLDFNGSGLSLLEISHRSKDFVAVMDEARALALELLGLENQGYQALFLHGGASLQFATIPYNLLASDKKASYLETGTWAVAAAKEARLFGSVEIAGSSKDANFNYIPKNIHVSADASYLHLTSNNTIFGTQINEFPEVEIPVVCDMSSDIFSRELDFTKFDYIYAGAQKNMGPAGVALVVVKESILGKVDREIPSMLDLQKHIKAESMYNTPPCFAVYTSLLTMQWIKEQGGLAAVEARNKEKAALLYAEIDRNALFKSTVLGNDRSVMNATFVLTNESLQERFDSMWKAANISGLTGHRSVGGYRASMYNAMKIESVQTLVEVMKEFEKQA